MFEVGIATLKRLISNQGADRVSDSAAYKLRDILEEKGVEVSKLAIELAGHAGRATVTEKDISEAIRILK